MNYYYFYFKRFTVPPLTSKLPDTVQLVSIFKHSSLTRSTILLLLLLFRPLTHFLRHATIDKLIRHESKSIKNYQNHPLNTLNTLKFNCGLISSIQTVQDLVASSESPANDLATDSQRLWSNTQTTSALESSI